MADPNAAALNFLNALERIPKMIDQYKAQNRTLERDIPTLQEIANSSWKKEDDLKKLKCEQAVLERKMQLTLAPKYELKPNGTKGNQMNSVSNHKCIAI